MGIYQFIRTLKEHPAMKNVITNKLPVYEYLLIDYNSIMYYIFNKTIFELNEILYYTYYLEKNTVDICMKIILENLEIPIEKINKKIIKFDKMYYIGTNYLSISKNMMINDYIEQIIIDRTIQYTKKIISKLENNHLKKIFFAIDGQPSIAKIKERKTRKIIGIYINRIKNNIINKLKFNNDNIYQIDYFFYRSIPNYCSIEKIQNEILHINTSADIEISTLDIKGEGEQKIIAAIKKQSNFDSYCILSLDSDLILLLGFLGKYKVFKSKKMYNIRLENNNFDKIQVIDIKRLIEKFQLYFTQKIKRKITKDNISSMLFMLFVFGNDYLPSLEPLSLPDNFDFICKSCLKILTNNIHFTKNYSINTSFLVAFFEKINKKTIKIATEKILIETYKNYKYLCHSLTIKMEQSHKNTIIRPIKINYLNIERIIKLINRSFYHLFSFLNKNIIDLNKFDLFYDDFCEDVDHYYTILVLPYILRYPNCSYNLCTKQFLFNFVKYMNITTSKNRKLSLITKLIPRQNPIIKFTSNTVSSYKLEIKKLNDAHEPYQSIFNISTVNLVYINKGIIHDNRNKYYDIYVEKGLSKYKIKKMVENYVTGIEWLYKQYTCEDLNEMILQSKWYYNNTRPPLIDDIIKYLKNTHKKNELLNYNTDPNKYECDDTLDFIPYIDGYGSQRLNQCQIKWHKIEKYKN